MVYETLFVLGLIGFVAMSLMGFVHLGDHGAGHGADGGHLHLGHGHGGDAAIGHGHATDFHLGNGHSSPIGHAHAGHGHDSSHGHGSDEASGRAPWFFISPITVFSLLIGAGAVGMIVHGRLDVWLTAGLAAIGGFAFNALLMRPIMRLILSFSGKPSKGLEGTVAQTAEAISSFDEQGKGLVKLEVEGEIVQILASLDPHDAQTGPIHKGDRLTVLEIDPKRNTCLVTRELDS